MTTRLLALIAALSVAIPCTAASRHSDLLGDPVPPATADYTLTVGPATKYLTVHLGDTVAFVTGSETFAWDFDSDVISALDLRQIAPPGALDHQVTVYVSEFRRYFDEAND